MAAHRFNVKHRLEETIALSDHEEVGSRGEVQLKADGCRAGREPMSFGHCSDWWYAGALDRRYFWEET
jgi:hypothetical protein